MSKEKNRIIPKLRFPEFKGNEEWTLERLCDIGEVLQGYGFPEKYQGKVNGAYPFFKVSDISNSVQNGTRYIEQAVNYIDDSEIKELNIKTIPIGTTIFAKIGEGIRLNRRAITICGSAIDNNVAGVKSIKGKSIDSFVFYILSKINLIEFSGGAVPSVNKTTIESIPIIIPKTIIEQQKIADCLSSLDDIIMAENQKLEALKAHKNGLMHRLFPAEGEKVPRLRFKEFSKNGDWEEYSVDQLIIENIIFAPKDGNHGNIHPKSSDYVKAGIPFIMASDLQNGQIDFTKCAYLRKEQADSLQKGFAKEGDVLLSHKGTVGEVVLLKKVEFPYIMLTPQVTYYRIKDQSKLSNKYLAAFFTSDFFQSKLKIAAGGGTRDYIGILEQGKLKIKMSGDVLEQHKIAECLASLDDLIIGQDQKIGTLKAHKNGLMQQLFPNTTEIEA